MLSLVLIALISAALGSIVWGVDKHRSSYGALLPSGAGVVVSLLFWMLTVAMGLSYQPGLTWIPWFVGLLAGAIASVLVSLYLGRRRHGVDTEKQTQILKMY